VAEKALHAASAQEWVDKTIDAVSEQPWLDQIAIPVRQAIHRAYEAGGNRGRQIKNAVHGGWLGHPVHPVLVDVPMGAWATALVLDTADARTNDPGYRRSANVAVAVGLAGGIGAALTGLTDWSETDGRPRRLGLLHGLLNLTAVSLYATSLLVRRDDSRRLKRACRLAGFIATCAAGYLGGVLIYRERVGVTHADQGGPKTYRPVLDSRDLRDDDKRRIMMDDAPIVVARQNGKVCALAEHCAHLGGPLSEGTLKKGSIVCPWHGSEFALADGHVINGPSAHPQPCLEARDNGDHIEVRTHPG
jgi:nitrite reductase/ring-hydroxylating ferredoxin subunit